MSQSLNQKLQSLPAVFKYFWLRIDFGLNDNTYLINFKFAMYAAI